MRRSEVETCVFLTPATLLYTVVCMVTLKRVDKKHRERAYPSPHPQPQPPPDHRPGRACGQSEVNSNLDFLPIKLPIKLARCRSKHESVEHVWAVAGCGSDDRPARLRLRTPDSASAPPNAKSSNSKLFSDSVVYV